MGRSWAQDIADVSLPIRCGGEEHLLRWSGGRVRADAHPDLIGEAALAAFGGDLPPCVDAALAWLGAVADGGFLAEWSEIDLDDPVYRHHLQVAVNRLRVEGVQDLLRGLPPRRAEAMGRFLLQFPQAWVDRAALGVVRGGRRLPPGAPELIPVRRAVQVRARSAFVRSLSRWAAVVRPAALVRFDCQVLGWEATPAASGILDGTASWCRVGLSPRWLLEVWGRGAALDRHGDLVLDGEGRRLRWQQGSEGRLAAVVEG